MYSDGTICLVKTHVNFLYIYTKAWVKKTKFQHSSGALMSYYGED